jgi:hypothetical protein
MLRKLTEELLTQFLASDYSYEVLGPAYIHDGIAFLDIPKDELKRIISERKSGITSHHLEIWRPYLFKFINETKFYLTEAEFKDEVSEPISTKTVISTDKIFIKSDSKFLLGHVQADVGSFELARAKELNLAAIADKNLTSKSYSKFAKKMAH